MLARRLSKTKSKESYPRGLILPSSPWPDKTNPLEFIWFGDTWLVPGCCWWRCSECREQSGARGHAAQPLLSDPRLLSLSASTMQQHAAPRHPRQALAPQYSPISIILIFLITFNKHIITNCSSPSWHHIGEWWLRLLYTMLCLIMKRSAYTRRGPLNITVCFHEMCETVTSAGAVSTMTWQWSDMRSRDANLGPDIGRCKIVNVTIYPRIPAAHLSSLFFATQM